MTTTSRSGAPTLAPMAAGTEKPIVPIPPLVSRLRGEWVCQVRTVQIWLSPTSGTTIVSLGMAAWIFRIRVPAWPQPPSMSFSSWVCRSVRIRSIHASRSRGTISGISAASASWISPT